MKPKNPIDIRAPPIPIYPKGSWANYENKKLQLLASFTQNESYHDLHM